MAEAPTEPARPRPSPGAASTGRALSGGGALAVGLAGLALGLAATAVVLQRGWDPGAVAVGPWVARPRVGTPSIDPYARAELARSGAVPMASAEGLSFTATTDETGDRLSRTCSYRLGGDLPQARFWTLTATGRGGAALGDASRPAAMTSADVLRDDAGRFTIEAGSRARPGNWLALSGEGPLALTLRLYDTSLTANPPDVATAALPTIARLSCAGAGP